VTRIEKTQIKLLDTTVQQSLNQKKDEASVRAGRRAEI